MVSEETKNNFDSNNLQLDINGFTTLDTYTFTKEVLERLRKENYNNNLTNISIEDLINEPNINSEVNFFYYLHYKNHFHVLCTTKIFPQHDQLIFYLQKNLIVYEFQTSSEFFRPHWR